MAYPLQYRLTAIGGRTIREVAAMHVNPAAFSESQPWANFVLFAHSEAQLLEQSLTVAENSITKLIVPRGNIILSVGDPASIAQDLSPAIYMEVVS